MASAIPSSASEWIDFLSGVDLPVRRRTAAALEALRACRDEVDARSIAAAVSEDPFLAMRIFVHLARLRRGAAADITTIERAVVMIGVPPFFRTFGALPIIEERLAGHRDALAGLLRILRRARRASHFALLLGGWRNDLGVDELMLAAQLHDLAEMLVWCFAPERALEMRRLLASAPGVRSVAAQRAVLGAALSEVEAGLVSRWRLPAILAALVDDEHRENPRVRCVSLAVRLARHSSRGWSDPALPDDYRDVAQLLSTTPRHAMEMIQPAVPLMEIPALGTQ